MPEQDWRTDPWAGHKPTFQRYGRDKNFYFPRTGREAFGHMWDDSVIEEVNSDDLLESFLNFKLSIGVIFLIITAVAVIGFFIPEIRQIFA